MNNMQDDLVTMEIDLEELKKNELNENFSRMFAGALELALNHMFGWKTMRNFKGFIKGKPSDVKSLAKTLGHEKKYIEAVKKHGLDNPATFKQKSVLEKAVKGFEKTTGLKWPFK
jgi:hypothetical protein